MTLFNISLIIAETRKALGITQEQLAEGICSRETIVKIEKGERRPNWFITREILRRLGLDTGIYQTEIVSKTEIEKYNRINAVYGAISAQKFDEAKAVIDELESEHADPAWQSGLWLQMLLRAKAYFYSYGVFAAATVNPYANAHLAIKNATDCLNFFREGFDLDKIPKYYLAPHEVITIRCIAQSYASLGDTDKAIEILKNVKENMEKDAFIMQSSNPGFHEGSYLEIKEMLCFVFQTAQRFEECLALAEEGEQYSIHRKNLISYLTWQTLKAHALTNLNRIDEADDFFKKVLLFHYIFDKKIFGCDFSVMKQMYEGMANKTLNLDVPW